MFFLLLAACAGSDLPVGDATAGADLYASTCASCHAADGTGGAGPSLVSATPGKSDAELTDIIQNGTGDMAAQGLDDQQTADVVAFLVQSWG